VLAALWPAQTRRATLNALASLLAAAGGFAVIGGLAFFWSAAVLSLIEGPTGAWVLAVLYAVVAVAIPVPMLWAVQGLSALQRSRLRATLGIEIPPTPPHAERGPWPIGPWRAAATWRQLGFHLLALVIGGFGGGLVLACWAAPVVAIVYLAGSHPPPAAGLAAIVVAVIMLLAAPWAARWVTRADEASARELLGLSRSDELALQVESLARSRAESVAATDAERRRIERDLHDGTQQRLVSLAMNLGMARANLTDLPAARRAIAEAHDEAVLALSELREFIRGLHPAVLNDRGLDAALSGIVAHAPMPVRLRVDVATRSSPSIEAVAYFVVSEALANVAKHAHATRAEVTVTRTGDLLRVAITDDGRGGAAIPSGIDAAAAVGGGTGLLGLAQRAAAVDGTLTVDSPPGGPTTITAELPCES
jgi:signal transduction histidine kinase